MKSLYSTLTATCLVAGFVLGGVLIHVKAEDLQSDVTFSVGENIKESKEVLVKAIELKTDIENEINRIREQRQEEIDNLKKFILNAEKSKFRNYDIRTKSNLKGYQLEKALTGTKLEGLGDSYADAEQTYGVSAIVLMAISAHESSWGTSNLAQERNNLFGFQAYDRDVDAATIFKTKRDCILTVAKHLAKNYLSEDGPYHKGYTLKDVNHSYASDPNWADSITAVMNSLVDRLK